MNHYQWDSMWQDSAAHHTQFGSGQATEIFTDMTEGSQATEPRRVIYPLLDPTP